MNILLFLGAGFSKEADLPLQKDFHEMAYTCLEKGYFNLDVYKGVSSAYHLARYIEGQNQVTLEEAFGILEYNYLTHTDDYKIAFYDNLGDPSTFHPADEGISIREARQNFISAIEEIYGYNENHSYRNIQLYKLFFKKILEKHNAAVVTTNYDLVCETALGKSHTQFPGYSVFHEHEIVPVLKLHGSINWKETAMDLPNIIPPTWMKSFDRQGKYGFVWGWAEDAISSSDLILFVGYSMPEIDIGIKYLIRSGLQPRIREHRTKQLIVVNPDEEIQERYNALRIYCTVESIEFILRSFRDLAERDLDDIL